MTENEADEFVYVDPYPSGGSRWELAEWWFNHGVMMAIAAIAILSLAVVNKTVEFVKRFFSRR